MPFIEIIIKNETGLHARPANDFVTFVKTLSSSVEIENEAGKRVKATSLIKMLSLGIKKGSRIKVHCEGEKESENLEQIAQFLENLKS